MLITKKNKEKALKQLSQARPTDLLGYSLLKVRRPRTEPSPIAVEIFHLGLSWRYLLTQYVYNVYNTLFDLTWNAFNTLMNGKELCDCSMMVIHWPVDLSVHKAAGVVEAKYRGRLIISRTNFIALHPCWGLYNSIKIN